MLVALLAWSTFEWKCRLVSPYEEEAEMNVQPTTFLKYLGHVVRC
jgi:hypothetical protein